MCVCGGGGGVISLILNGRINGANWIACNKDWNSTSIFYIHITQINIIYENEQKEK